MSSVLQERAPNAHVARHAIPPPPTNPSGPTDCIDLAADAHGVGGGKENNAAQTKSNKPANSKKRKSDAQDDIKAIMFPADAPVIDDDHPALDGPFGADQSCQKTRQKIRKWIESGAQKVGEFQQELGVSSRAYHSFMNRTGTWDGEHCDTYRQAAIFFKKRELAGLPLAVPKAKKPKTAATAGKGATAKGATGKTAQAKTEDLLDTGDIILPGEEKCAVSVFMTCDEVRKHIRALMAKGVTQAALCRALSSMYPPDSGKSVSPANLRYFMGQKGVREANTNPTFYAGYCLFEKQRLKDNKPKSEFRLGMEQAHGPLGLSVTDNVKRGFFMMADEQAVLDKYGRLHFIKG
jgi:hypothetical protein